jgi:hypothetical protein
MRSKPPRIDYDEILVIGVVVFVALIVIEFAVHIAGRVP